MKKRLLALLMTAAMVMGMATTAFAAEEPASAPTGTITSNDDGHTYEIYQILTGNVKGSTIENPMYGKDANGEEGKAVSPTDMAALKAIAEAGDAGSGVLDQTDIETMSPYVKIDGEPAFKIEGKGTATVPTGYYVIVDRWQNGPIEEDALSLYMFKTITESGLTIEPKKSAPEHEKKVDDKNDTDPKNADDNKTMQDSADYDIGDDVPFHLSAKLGSGLAAAGYKTYSITFVDEMEAGLTNNKDYVVKVDGVEVDRTGYTLANETDRGFELTLTWNDPAVIAGLEGKTITVDFTAELNENAKIANIDTGSEGNMNKSKLKYSNNPNVDDEGKPEGETPWDEVFVFTYKLTANKVNGNGDDLDGAGFTLYKKIAGVTENEGWVAVGPEQQGEQLHNFEWKGLDDGQYKLVETTVPAGYNKADDILFTITAEHKADGASAAARNEVLTSVSCDNTVLEQVASGTFDTEVVNNSGVVLPSTGGMGTTIIYVLGGILLAGAAIVLVTRKRMAQ